ncbi:hypothetical protein IEQ34_003680 [Dendrobium chrysotoxum]|uniref:Uncharacterized protein n=1 Tax=Dendrobium chrysotoxum TaxID=161865 RepID=A0AAV7HF25_DENCH|nr:hypothetical protein IEQ34_003680 [Dendrobium chrysotoxum]
MQWKTGVQVEGVTPSHASDDFPSDSDGYEIESELQKVFDLDMDNETNISYIFQLKFDRSKPPPASFPASSRPIKLQVCPRSSSPNPQLFTTWFQDRKESWTVYNLRESKKSKIHR